MGQLVAEERRGERAREGRDKAEKRESQEKRIGTIGTRNAESEITRYPINRNENDSHH
jgi:hypothetical protein